MTAGSPSASPTGVWVLGGFQTDFARNLTREGRDVADLVGEVVDGTLEASRVAGDRRRGRPRRQRLRPALHRAGPPRRDAGDRPCRPVGRCRPPATRPPARPAGSPSWRRWPTCAPDATTAPSCSGSSSRRPCPATRPPRTSARPRGWGTRARMPRSCGRTCSARSPTSTTGATASTTRTCAPSRALNLAQRPAQPERPDPRLGRSRPAAERRRPTTPLNPVVEGRLRRYDCSQVTDGAAGVVLVSRSRGCATTRTAPTRRPASLGWGHRTVGLGAARRSSSATGDEPTSCRTCGGPSPTPSTEPARRRSRTSTVSRRTTASRRPSTSPSTTSGSPGRASRGRPSRTASSSAVAACRSTRAAASSAAATRWAPPGSACSSTPPSRSPGPAGDYQVEGARTFATLNIGGSTATTVCLVVGAVD